MTRAARAVVLAGSALAALAALHSVWNLRQLRVLPGASHTPGRVSVLIPARDEAADVGRCLLAVRRQQQVPSMEIVVFDDRSSDGTASVVQHHLEADARIRLIIADGEPPAGWLGKTWACHRLAEAAKGEVLVFVDADVRLAPDALARTIALLGTPSAAGIPVDAVSPYPRQLAETWSERLVQPLLQWSWATLLPLRLAERSNRTSLVAANGQLLAITRDAYDGIGGHAAVRGQVLDDIALFQRLKRSGRRGVLADGTEVAGCRMYDGWADVREGYTKSLWSVFPSPAQAAAFCGLMALMYVVPPVAALLRGSRVGFAGYAVAVAGRAVVARRAGGRVWPDPLTHPVSTAAFCHLMLRSWRGRRRGTLTWKARPLP